MILLWGAAAWLGGVVLAALGLGVTWPLLALAAGSGAVGLLAAKRQREALALATLTLVALLGVARYETERPPAHPGGIAVYNDGDAVHLRGSVGGEPETHGSSQRLRLNADAVEVAGAWQPTQGAVLVTTRLFPALHYGDRLELTAQLTTPPRFDGFDYREYLARQGVVSLMAFPQIRRLGNDGNPVAKALYGARDRLGTALGRTLPQPEAALAQGMLLGQRSDIPAGLTDDFNAAGISHLVAISGYNVMIVAAAGLAAFTPLLGRRRAVLAAMALIVGFSLFVGASPSVLRAALMGEVMLGAVLAGRPGSSLTAVALTGAALTAWQPSIIEDVAFQLSFGATLGIVLLATPLQSIIASLLAGRLPDAAAGFVAESVGVTGAASLAALPIIAATFGSVSLVVLPANLLAGFDFPFILATSALASVAGLATDTLGRLAGNLAYLPLWWLIEVGHVAASVPGATLSVGSLGRVEALGITAIVALLALPILRWRPRAPVDERTARLRVSPVLALAALVVLAAGVTWWHVLAPQRDGRLVVSVLDVGQGDSILIQTPSGRRILVDGGPSGDVLAQDLGRALPASAHSFDLLVLTHGQDDHLTGLIDVLARYQVGELLENPLPGTSQAFQALQDEVAATRVPVHTAVAGERVDLGDGARLEVLAPPDPPIDGTDDDLNSNSIVLRLVDGAVSFLLTGDLSNAGEASLLRSGADVQATVLKVGHHGSETSTTSPFLAAVDPSVAVISVGADNSYGQPSPSTRLRLAGVPLLRTDLNGTVRFETDGAHLWESSERGAPTTVSLAETSVGD